MTVTERLRSLVAAAPPGTLVPVASLAELLDEERLEVQQQRTVLTLDDVAERAEAEIFGGSLRPSTGAVRKWITRGKDGVKLEAFGRPYVVHPEAWDRFVQALRRAEASPQGPIVVRPPAEDPADELAAFETESRKRKGGR